MIRVLSFLAAGALVAVLAYALLPVGLSTGGHSHGASFSFGSINVRYEINAPATLRSERLEYVILSEGEPQSESVHNSNGIPVTITRVYVDAGKTNRISFSTKPGQTVWIGKDRSVHIASAPLQLSDVKLIEQHSGEGVQQTVSSLEDLRKALVALRAEPSASPNAAPPHR